MENPRGKVSEEDRCGLWLLALVLSPILLSLFFVLTYEEPAVDSDDSREETIQSYTRPSSGYVRSASSNTVYQSNTTYTENSLINSLSEEDYYEYSDYHDGLDSEHSDIDYNEVKDYFED